MSIDLVKIKRREQAFIHIGSIVFLAVAGVAILLGVGL